MHALDTQRVTLRKCKTQGVWLAAIAAWLVFASYAAAESARLPAGPPVSAAEEQSALDVFQDRAGRFRETAEQRVRVIVTRLQAAMDLTGPVPSQLLNSNDVNAYSRSGTIYVTLPMLRFVKTDDELALVVGHEIGHLLVDRHPDADRSSSEERERVADYYALIGVHRAGYDITAACEVWLRMATELKLRAQSAHAPAFSPNRGTGPHPSFAERYVRAHKLAKSLLDGNLPFTAPAGPPGAPSPSRTTHSLR
jgi:predicted Zn-dependent protease